MYMDNRALQCFNKTNHTYLYRSTASGVSLGFLSSVAIVFSFAWKTSCRQGKHFLSLATHSFREVATKIASSSSLHTVRLWFLFKSKYLSQSPQKEAHLSHLIMATVSPSSWLEHFGRLAFLCEKCSRICWTPKAFL